MKNIVIILGFIFLYVLLWGKENLVKEVEKLLKSSNYSQAKLIVQQSIQKEPDIASHYVLLSRIYREEKRYSNAYRVISEAYHYFPKNPWVGKEFADIYRGMGEYRKALALYRQSLVNIEEKYHPLWYYGMGVCYFELEEYDKAIMFLERSIRNNLSFWNLYYLGKAYRGKKMYTRAIWAFERSELQLFLQPDWATNLLYYEWGKTLLEFSIAIKETNTNIAKTLLISLTNDKRFQDRRVKERAEFWIKRL